jgi:hypothetical protein
VAQFLPIDDVAQIPASRTKFPTRVDCKKNWEFAVNSAAINELTFSLAVEVALDDVAVL